MKKLLVVLLIVILILPLGGCALLDLFPSTVTPTEGVWEDDVFVSEYLELRFMMPFGWAELSARELARLTDIAEADFDLANTSIIIDTMVMCHVTGTNIQISYIPYGRGTATVDDIMEATIAELERETGAHVTQVPGTTIIAGQEWHSFSAKMDSYDYTTFIRHFLNVYEGYTRNIVISYTPEIESAEDFLHLFVGLNDPLPARPLLADSDVLLGLWEWDQDLGFVYEFDEDGSGRSGWLGQTEEFRWYVLDDSLYIVTPQITEHWAFTIDDGILTMDSRQEVGLTWSYSATVDANIAEHATHAPELVGTWDWDEDTSFSLILNANGTGERGFPENLEHFEWTTIDDNLLIDTPLMLESWTFAVVDNVLTIDSRQAPGLTWSYIAR